MGPTERGPGIDVDHDRAGGGNSSWNCLVESACSRVENDWVGHTLVIGDEVRLQITGPCPRCVMTTLPQGDLPKDAGILRTAAQNNQANVGVYAAVVTGGTVRRGDGVSLA